MRISDWSSDVCSSDLIPLAAWHSDRSMWSVAADADAPPPSAASPIKASSSRPKKRIGWIAAPVIRRAMAAKYWESFTKSGRHFGRPALLGLSSSGEHRRQIFGERRVVEIVLGPRSEEHTSELPS